MIPAALAQAIRQFTDQPDESRLSKAAKAARVIAFVADVVMGSSDRVWLSRYPWGRVLSSELQLRDVEATRRHMARMRARITWTPEKRRAKGRALAEARWSKRA